MPFTKPQLLDTRDLNRQDIEELFSLAKRYQEEMDQQGRFVSAPEHLRGGVVAMLFLEPSTRTRLSFQMAGKRLGLNTIVFSAGTSSSLSKGETLEDTLENVLAMQPDALIIRYGESAELDRLLPTLDIPVISGGSHTVAHPTQGLLDAYCMHREFGHLQGLKVFIFGDLKYSRVARSNFDVLTKMGAEVAAFAPPEFQPPDGELRGVRVFNDMQSGLEWAQAVMALRIQFERIPDHLREHLAPADYHMQYGLTRDRLAKLDSAVRIFHPGPVNYGLELAPEVRRDGRTRIYQQVTGGVYIRAAVLTKLMS